MHNLDVFYVCVFQNLALESSAGKFLLHSNPGVRSLYPQKLFPSIPDERERAKTPPSNPI